MKLDWRLQDYLNSNELKVELVGARFGVRNKEGKVVCTGVSALIAVRKYILINTCPCHQCTPDHKRGARKKATQPLADDKPVPPWEWRRNH